MRIYRSIAFTVFILLIVLPVAYADLGGDEIKEISGMREMLPELNLSFPVELSAERQAYVFVTIGSAYTKVAVLALSEGVNDPALWLNKALRGADLPSSHIACGSMLYYTAAEALIRHPHYGGRSARNSVPLGRIISALRAQGIRPYVVLRVPIYASLSGLDLPKHTGRKYLWYNATSAPAGSVAVVRASVSPGLIVLLIYLRFFLPALGLVSIIIGLVIGMNRRLPVPKRMEYFGWLTMMIPLLAGLSGGLTFLVFDHSIFQRMISDIWFAYRRAELTFFVSLIADVIIALVIPLACFAARSRIFDGLDEEPDIADLEMLMRQARKRERIAVLLSGLFLLYLLLTRPFDLSLSRILGSNFVSLIITPCFLYYAHSSMWRPSFSDPDLTNRAKELAPRLGVNIGEVRVVTSSYAKKEPNGCVRKRGNNVYITQKAVEVLTPEQMDYLLLHELAHFRDRAVYTRASSPFGLLLTIGTLVTLAIAFFTDNWNSLLAIWLIGIMPWVVLIGAIETNEIRRRLEYEADFQAIYALGDLNAAISGLKAVKAHSSNPEAHDQELDEHPKLIKRIKAMKAAAAKAGIPDNIETT